MRFPTLFAAVTVCLIFGATHRVTAQDFYSPIVSDKRPVTFRLEAPKAHRVEVEIDGERIAMRETRDRWEVQSPPLAPGIHDYVFYVDGTRTLDPRNRWLKKWRICVNMVEVPGNPPLLTERQAVPHGVIHRHYYASESVGHERPLMVYTPPGYTADKQYPLVLLLHGFGDDETAWTEVGRAHFIADNLIAAGQIEPVVIAMPWGHPVPVPEGDRPDDYRERNNAAYREDLMKSVLPFVESNYRVRREAAGRSIVGLSMGGGHALDTGFRNTDQFSAIGGFSASAPVMDFEQYPAFKGPNPVANSRLQHLWIAIGEDDFLMDRNQTLLDSLKSEGVNHTYLETEGGHKWRLWRDYLAKFLTLVAPATTN